MSFNFELPDDPESQLAPSTVVQHFDPARLHLDPAHRVADEALIVEAGGDEAQARALLDRRQLEQDFFNGTGSEHLSRGEFDERLSKIEQRISDRQAEMEHQRPKPGPQ